MMRDGLGNWQPDKTARAPLPRVTRCAMPRAATPRRLLQRPPLLPLLLLLPTLLSALAQDIDNSILNTTAVDVSNGTSIILITSNDTLLDAANETFADGDHEPIVRKKRTFGDIVFRGLADVLGYNVARKPPEVAFPPPLAPVPGIDLPLQAATPAPVPAPAPTPAAATAPCGAPRAVAPPPCRARVPTTAAPRPRAAPPCPKPRAAPRRKPRPRPSPSPPPPPPPPPCAQPRANPSTAAPCAPATTPAPRAPAPKADNLETITSNFRLHFNFNRAPSGAAAAAAPAEELDEEQEQELEQEQEQEQFTPVAIEPRAALLPPAQARKPRVYVDAFVVRNGVPQKVDTLDAQHLNAQRLPLEDEYLVYDYEELQQLPDDDYEDVQESRDRSKAVSDFSDAVDKFWEPKKRGKKKLPVNDYRNVHFGDRSLAEQIRRREDDDESRQSLKRERSKTKKKTSSVPAEAEGEDEVESTTTTEDPKRPLRPRVLPPTEHNPGQIDTVTVRVPPIYKERRPKKLNRERPEHDEYPEHRNHFEEREARDRSTEHDGDADTEGEDSAWAARTERPARRKRRKQRRDKRAAREESYTAGDYDYYGNKLPISHEERVFGELTVPPPTKYAEFARLEKGQEVAYFLDDHERIREDLHKVAEDERSSDRYRADSSERADDSEVTDERERSEEAEQAGSAEETGRADDSGRADEHERTDRLGPNARVHETGFQNNYVRATNHQVDDPRPLVTSVKKKTTKIGKE